MGIVILILWWNERTYVLAVPRNSITQTYAKIHDGPTFPRLVLIAKADKGIEGKDHHAHHYWRSWTGCCTGDLGVETKISTYCSETFCHNLVWVLYIIYSERCHIKPDVLEKAETFLNRPRGGGKHNPRDTRRRGLRIRVVPSYAVSERRRGSKESTETCLNQQYYSNKTWLCRRLMSQGLIDRRVESNLDFAWQSQLRYYWTPQACKEMIERIAH